MKFSSSKKIIIEDFPQDARELVQRLALVLNPFLDQTAKILGTNVTLGENLKAKVWSLDLAAGVSSYTVAWDLNEKPTEVRIGNLTKYDGSAPSQPFSPSWRYANGSIILTIVGLDPATRHLVTVIGQV